MKRAIHIIPDTSRCPEIEALRQRFDWLHPHIPAHITLVSPFELPAGMADADLMHHCQAIAGEFQAFSVSLLPPERSGDDHCWVPVAPHPALSQLATRLHGGPLSALASIRHAFVPHITLARPPLAAGALAEIAALWPASPVTPAVDAVVLERIHADHRSEILGRCSLR